MKLMKKKLRLVPVILFAMALIPSCELLGDCKTCSKVTYIDGAYSAETPGVLYCGEKLSEKESQSPVIIGNVTTQWECY